jgi:hypothetical protein
MKMDIDRMLDHLSEFSIFDHSVPALFLILGVSFALTLLHTLQEWKGAGGPLWRNFGAIVGVWVPDWLGFPFFFLILTAALWLVALVAVTGSLVIYPVQPKYAAVALGALIGARLGDTVVSHVCRHLRGYRPNPGLASTSLYCIEAVAFIATFYKGLIAGGGFACVGLVIGVLFFCLVLPSLRSLRIVKSWRRDRWLPGEHLPAWTGIP